MTYKERIKEFLKNLNTLANDRIRYPEQADKEFLMVEDTYRNIIRIIFVQKGEDPYTIIGNSFLKIDEDAYHHMYITLFYMAILSQTTPVLTHTDFGEPVRNYSFADLINKDYRELKK